MRATITMAASLTMLLCAGISSSAQAADAQEWLGRIAQTEQQQSFKGSFVYERNGTFSTHAIWHRAEANNVRERVLQSDGSAQEILRVNGQTQCASGLLVDGLDQTSDLSARTLDIKRLATTYDIKLAGESRVAGRAAIIVALAPRDQHRFGYELHLDQDTGLPLKSLLLNEKGQLLERFQFVTFNPVNPSDADLNVSSECHKVSLSPPRSVVQTPWHSDWLPAGFVPTNTHLTLNPTTKIPVTSLMYSDGLARFSIFIEPLNGAKVEDARSQMGPTVAVSRRLSSSSGDVMATVVGEIPMGTAERIALSVRDVPAPATAKP